MSKQIGKTKKPRTTLKIFFISVAVFSISFQVGSMSEVTEREASLFIEMFKSQIEGIDGLGIFFHNLSVTTLMFVPGFGFGYSSFVAYQTGWAVSAATVLNPELEQLPALALLYVSPFGLMELFSYALAMTTSILWAKAIIKKENKKPLVKITIRNLAIVVGLLLIGGIIEWEMITWASEMGVDLF